jgi:SPP1 family predicted phage head-tail adaptor
MRERLNFGINPGRFRHTITLLQATSGTDASGVSVTYSQGATKPVTQKAEIRYLRGSESLKSGQDVSEIWIEVTTRYNAALARLGRFVAPDGNQYVIQSADNVQMRNVFLVMTCKGAGVGA